MVAVMGIAMVGAGQYWSTISKREKEAELLFRGDQIRLAIEAYHVNTPGSQNLSYPRTLEDLLKDDRYPDVRRYLRRVYLNPMREDGAWEIIVDGGGGIKGVFADSEEKPIKEGNFPEKYRSFEKAATYADWKFVDAPDMAGRPSEPPTQAPAGFPQPEAGTEPEQEETQVYDPEEDTGELDDPDRYEPETQFEPPSAETDEMEFHEEPEHEERPDYSFEESEEEGIEPPPVQEDHGELPPELKDDMEGPSPLSEPPPAPFQGLTPLGGGEVDHPVDEHEPSDEGSQEREEMDVEEESEPPNQQEVEGG
jgi:hypothetical protein